MRLFNKIIISSFLFYYSCSSANLKPNNSSVLQNGPSLKELTSSLGLDCEAREKVYTGLDTWHDSIPYLFTPLKNKVTKYSLRKNDQITFLSETVTIGVTPDISTLDRIYVESLLLYSDFFAQLCKPVESQFFYQTKFTLFDKVALYVKAKQGNAVDDYIVYFKNDAPRAVEFTYRDLSDSYVGYLRFSNWRTLKGRKMPLKIEILSELDDAVPVHEVSLEDYNRNPVN